MLNANYWAFHKILTLSIPVCLCKINIKFQKKTIFAHYCYVYILFIFKKTLHVSAVNYSQPSSGVCIAKDLSTQR